MTQGDLANCKNLATEPPDHGIGRSRGALSTKTHLLSDGHGLPLVVICGPGQAGDSPMSSELLDAVRVMRAGSGRARTRPDRVLTDKAYSSAAIRRLLRGQGIGAVIPERADQIQNRKNRGRSGGRPPVFDAVKYRDRNVVERGFNAFKQWRGVATRYDKHNANYCGGVLVRAIVLWLKRLRDTP
ncbi:IS5 family transposase [Gordonia humi]|uniref:IS5 family transposase n=1 Tax=Gordonia humi TaxID=686429 RepID=UPI001C84CC88